MHKRKRLQTILTAVEAQGVVTVDEMMKRLGASSATIRRDISELAENRQLHKVHGGAEALAHSSSSSEGAHALDYANTSHLAEKTAIASLAVSMCDEDETIIINGGSTTYQMVKTLRLRSMQVLTNSLPIASFLFEHSNVRLQVPGGEVYRDQHIILSPFDNDTIKNYSASKLFMGAHCLNRSGLLESDPRLIQAERKILSQADELIVLVDSSKFSAPGSLILCPLNHINTVVTDDGISDADHKMLEREGIRVEVVNIDRRSEVA